MGKVCGFQGPEDRDGKGYSCSIEFQRLKISSPLFLKGSILTQERVFYRTRHSRCIRRITWHEWGGLTRIAAKTVFLEARFFM